MRAEGARAVAAVARAAVAMALARFAREGSTGVRAVGSAPVARARRENDRVRPGRLIFFSVRMTHVVSNCESQTTSRDFDLESFRGTRARVAGNRVSTATLSGFRARATIQQSRGGRSVRLTRGWFSRCPPSVGGPSRRTPRSRSTRSLATARARPRATPSLALPRLSRGRPNPPMASATAPSATAAPGFRQVVTARRALAARRAGFAGGANLLARPSAPAAPDRDARVQTVADGERGRGSGGRGARIGEPRRDATRENLLLPSPPPPGTTSRALLVFLPRIRPPPRAPSPAPSASPPRRPSPASPHPSPDPRPSLLPPRSVRRRPARRARARPRSRSRQVRRHPQAERRHVPPRDDARVPGEQALPRFHRERDEPGSSRPRVRQQQHRRVPRRVDVAPRLTRGRLV